MSIETIIQQSYCEEAHKKTRQAFVWTTILNTPFWAIFNILPFILYKALNATPLQITMIIILKPAVSLIAVYWSGLIEKRRDRLISNLIWARVLSHLPFFFFPFIHNAWFFILSFGFYMMLARGSVPAWMEVLKLNISGVSRDRIYAYGSTLGYLGSAIIPLALGGVMDAYQESWRWIFFITAGVSLSALFFQWRIPIPNSSKNFVGDRSSQITWKQHFIKPWKSAWELMKRRPDFIRFQLGFMLGGAGLIIMQPMLPVFFMGELNLTYTELAAALTLCKGIGYALASTGWTRMLQKVDLFRFTSWVTFLAFLYPLCLMAAQFNITWLYGGFLLYGIMQAGSEMSWHLSGPIFAKDEDSSVYSSVNVLTVGLRGCFVPIIGVLLASLIHVTGVMLIGALLCLFSSIAMRNYSNQRVKSKNHLSDCSL